MSKPFHFKQFTVDQTGCAMKINTDGVLLGALAESESPKYILDIGTGTGVIALMLAQRFPDAIIDAIDIDEQAAATAQRNFFNSPFSERLMGFHSSFEDFFLQFSHKKYDLIVSNPPFFLNSLKNPDQKKNIARHTSEAFFEKLIASLSFRFSNQGSFWGILPLGIADLCKPLAADCGLHLDKSISIHSSKTHQAHRNIISFSKQRKEVTVADFIIYEDNRQFTQQYQSVLEPFFIIF